MKICIISNYDLIQRDTGGAVRTYYLAKTLAMQGHKVNVIVPGFGRTIRLNDRLVVKRTAGLVPYSFLKFFSILLGVSKVTSLYFYDVSFILRAYPTVLNCDIIQLDAQASVTPLITFFLTKIFKKPIVLDTHDAFQALKIEYSKTLRKVLEFPMEKIAYRFAKLILTVSEEDKKYLIKFGIRRDKIFVVPNGVDTSVFKPALNRDDIKNSYNLKDFFTVIFVGNMEYHPNQEAVNLIATKIAPKILSEIQNVRFLIVGRKPPKIPITPSLTFAGVVDNIAKVLAASDVAIAPLLHGSGTRLKILEYLSCGLPIVSTSIGIEGLKVKDGVNVLVEDDMDMFPIRVIELLQDEELRASIGDSGRDLVIREYDWRKIGKELSLICYHANISYKA